MNRTNFPSLTRWPRAFRQLLLLFHFTILFGYGVGFANLFVTHQTSMKGIRQNLLGMSESEMANAEQLILEKPLKDLIITTHNHVLSLSILFLIVGGTFLLITGKSGGIWLFLTVEPFFSLVLTFGGLWLARLVAAPFVILTLLSGILMHLTFSLMLLYNIFKLWMMNRTIQ